MTSTRGHFLLALCLSALAGIAIAKAQQQPLDGYSTGNGQFTSCGQGSCYSTGQQGFSSTDQTGGYSVTPDGVTSWTGVAPLVIVPNGLPQPIVVTPDPGY